MPLHALIVASLSMRNQPQQITVDVFFASVCGTPSLAREVSDRAFFKARDGSHLRALQSLNAMVVARAEAAGREQRFIALLLPGADLTLYASVRAEWASERVMLVGALSQPGPDDVLVLDQGYPAAWLVALLNDRGIRFIMRVADRRRGCRNHQRPLAARPHFGTLRQWSIPASPDSSCQISSFPHLQGVSVQFGGLTAAWLGKRRMTTGCAPAVPWQFSARNASLARA